MSLSYGLMVWHPDDIGARDDAFASGWTPTSCTMTKIDGDYIKLEQAGVGEAIIPAGETYVVVDHGCISTPKPTVTPKDNLGGRKYWTSDKNASTFRVNIDSPDLVDHAFDWKDIVLDCGGAAGLGFIEKTGISFNPDTHPYLVLGLWGNDKYWVEVYESGAWNVVVSATAAPTTYDFKVHYIGDLGLGTITGIRLGVAEVPNAELTYDFYEFHSRYPHFPEDLVKGTVYQRELTSDYFKKEIVLNGYVGSDVRLLLNMDEGLGEIVHDETANKNDGTITGASWVDGKFGKGLGFNGINEFVNCGRDSSLEFGTSEFSVEAWVYIPNPMVRQIDADEVFVSKGFGEGGVAYPGWRLWWDYWLGLSFMATDGIDYTPTAYQGEDISAGWYHLVGVRESTGTKIYVNAVEYTGLYSSGAAEDVSNPNVDLYIGCSYTYLLLAFFEGKIDAVQIRSRSPSLTDVKRRYDQGPPTRVYTPGRYIRIATARGSYKEKIFAGVIENPVPKLGTLEVDGRCFQVKIQRATKSADFTDEDLDTAVTTIAAGLGLTFSRVEAPVPQVQITKKYVEPYLSDALDELASLPSKQSPYEAWRWKVGYGQDLRFRAFSDADVRACTTTIDSSTNVLRGILRGSDIYKVANKVIVISGTVDNPENDEWCEQPLFEWTSANVADIHGSYDRTKGATSVAILSEIDNYHWSRRSFSETDFSEYKRIVFDAHWAPEMEDAAVDMSLRIYSAGGGYFEYTVVNPSQKGLLTNEYMRYEIPLDHPGWSTFGSPSWTDITSFMLFCVNGLYDSLYYFIDNFHFEAENIQREATDPSSEVAETRTFLYKDENINRISQTQDVADALIELMKEAANRWVVPVIGYPDLQRGRKVTVNIPEMDIVGDYYIAEAEHIFGRGVGYEVWVMLTDGRFDISLELAKTLQTELRRESLGGVEILG